MNQEEVKGEDVVNIHPLEGEDLGIHFDDSKPLLFNDPEKTNIGFDATNNPNENLKITTPDDTNVVSTDDVREALKEFIKKVKVPLSDYFNNEKECNTNQEIDNIAKEIFGEELVK